jgi:hypothetical protein
MWPKVATPDWFARRGYREQLFKRTTLAPQRSPKNGSATSVVFGNFKSAAKATAGAPALRKLAGLLAMHKDAEAF